MLMRALVGVGLCVMVFVACVSSGQVSAVSTNWNSGTPFVQHSRSVQSEIVHKCRNTLVDYDIAGEIGNKPTCIDETGPLRFGYYSTSHGVQHVVGFGREKKLYKLSGMQCDHTCIYSPEQDTLVTRQNIINGFVKSLVIYKNFSSRLNINYDIGNYGGWYAEVTDRTPSYTFQFESSYPYPVNGMGLSNNGRYLGFEARQRGLLILDIQTMTIKRLSNYGYSYGYGLDPEVEIAVTDDSNSLIAVGENAGIKFFTGLLSCGDIPNDDNMSNVTAIEQGLICNEISLDTNQFIGNFISATLPSFTPSGLGVKFFARSSSGETRDVYIKSAGSNIQTVRLMGMGDSYSSGEGESDESMYLAYTDTESEKCHTSKRSYALLVGDKIGMSSRTRNLSCSGAVTADILGLASEGYIGQGDRLKSISKATATQMQRDAIDQFIPGRIGQIDFAKEYQPEAILVGIGGNDVGLVGKLKACMGPSTCHYAEIPDERLKVALQIRGLYETLHRTYKTIHLASPASRIYAVGYPQIISESGRCDLINNFLFDNVERRFMREAISYINHVVQSAATRAGVMYIDIEDVYGNATLCGESSQSVMNGVVAGDDIGPFRYAKIIGNESFHPKPTAHELTANRIVGLEPNLTGALYCQGVSYICPQSNNLPAISDFWIDGADLSLLNLEVKQLHYSIDPDTTDSHIRSVSLPAGSFKPGSSVSIGVRSDIISLGDYISTNDGSLDLQIELPDNLEYGYHTLVISGENSMGGSLEYQQIFLYEDETNIESNAPSLDNDSPNVETVGIQTTQVPIQDNAETAGLNLDSAVLGSQDVKDNNNLDTNISPSSKSASDSFWLAYLGVGAVSLGLFGAVLYIRKARHTIKT